MIKYFAIIFLLFLLNSCSKNGNNIVNPYFKQVDFGDTTNAIFLSSFEQNGTPSLNGWNSWGSLSTSTYSFSDDVPIGGGNWSLQLKGAVHKDIGVIATIDLYPFDSLKNYIVTFWAKGKGYVTISMDAPDRGIVSFPNVNCNSWTLFADTLFRQDVALNKLSILLTESDPDSLNYVLFDNIKVVVKLNIKSINGKKN